MHIDELRSRFGLSRHVIHELRRDGIIPPPSGSGRWARYGPEHVAAIAAYRALKDFLPSSPDKLAQHLREEGISIVEYLKRRETHLKDFGLGPA